VSLLVNADRIALIMKDGQIHKHAGGHAHRRAAA
jgi:hypothetical protein